MLDSSEVDWSFKTSGTEEAPIHEWRTVDRIYRSTPTTFTKRQCKPHESVRAVHGGVAEGRFNRERLENERDALEFIAKNTSIPVPRVLEWSVEEGVAAISLEKIKGECMLELVDSLTAAEQQTLQDNVEKFVHEVVLPQLARLRSNRLGQISGALFPPNFVNSVDRRPTWNPKVSNVARYVYCHNDLAQQNLMIDPDTLKVVALID